MRRYIYLVFPLLSLMLGVFAPLARGGVFVSESEAQSFSGNSSPAAQRSFFREHLGSSSPKQWALNQPGTISSTKFFGSAEWRTIDSAYQQSFTGTLYPQSSPSLHFQFEKAIGINNVASSRSLDVKGSLGEDLMDDFYRKDGWEPIDGKRGRQGIDGLYVKRDKNGRIKDFLVADAKTGSSKLQETLHGTQLDDEWCEHNFQELLKKARQAKPEDPKRVADMERLLDLKRQGKGRTPRVYEVRIENGVCVMTNKDVKGNVIGKPYKVNMRGNGWQQKRIYESIEKNIAKYNPKGAATITAKIRDGYAKGTFQNDSDLYRAIKREIPDRKLADRIARDLKAGETSKQATKAKGKQLVSRAGGLKGGAAQAGAALLMGSVQGGWSAETLLGVGKGLAMDVATDTFVEQGARYGSRALAESQLKGAGKKVTEKALSKSAGKLAPSVGKFLGAGVSVGFALWEIRGYYNQYSAGTISQEEFRVHSSIAVAGAAGGAAASYIAVGLAAGAAGGPVGIVIGVGSGAVVALGAAAVDYLYTQSKEAEKREKFQKEMGLAAEEAARWSQEEKEKKLNELRKQSESKRTEAWSVLLAS